MNTTNTNAPLVGVVIDGCTLERAIGEGERSTVYLATHTESGERFAVKVLSASTAEDTDWVQRFFREAKALGQLDHPTIVSVKNVGQEGEHYFMRMEYVAGKTIHELVLEGGKLNWEPATTLVLDIADALGHCHESQLIHRGVEPGHVMLTGDQEVKLTGFSLVKQVDPNVSITSQEVGSPHFMSPEQAGGKPVDARSDLYSLGCTFYYLLTGELPFPGKTAQEVFLKHFFHAPVPLERHTPDLPDGVHKVIRKCLRKKKAERYQSAASLTEDLRELLGLEAGE